MDSEHTAHHAPAPAGRVASIARTGTPFWSPEHTRPTSVASEPDGSCHPLPVPMVGMVISRTGAERNEKRPGRSPDALSRKAARR